MGKKKYVYIYAYKYLYIGKTRNRCIKNGGLEGVRALGQLDAYLGLHSVLVTTSRIELWPANLHKAFSGVPTAVAARAGLGRRAREKRAPGETCFRI